MKAGQEHLGIPIRFKHEPGSVDFSSPTLGEHSVEVARQLRFSEQQILAMKKDGVFGRNPSS